MKKLFCAGFVLFTLLGCGGGSSPEQQISTPPQIESQPPEETAEASAPLFPPVLSATTCPGLDFINLVSAQTSSDAVGQLTADNAIDDDLSEGSRWESNTQGSEITIDLGYRHLVKEVGTAWFEGNQVSTTFDVQISEDGSTYTRVLAGQVSSGETTLFERFEIQDIVARFVRIIGMGNSIDDRTSLLEAAVFGCPLDVDTAPIDTQAVDTANFELDPNVPPGQNFDLLTWSIDTPETDPEDGLALRTSERDLDRGYESADHFFTNTDGGMVFRSTIFGATTSQNTRFPRSELREMLRRGDTSIRTQGVGRNNWILGYQPDPMTTVGGRGGLLKATLRIDHVTTTGTEQHQGRVIIGQIHADNDEPLRLYFKKFPNNDRGYIYFAHEIREGDDIWIVALGPENTNRDNEAIFTQNPDQGIELGEIFSYEIHQDGSRIDVIVRRGDENGPIIGHNFVDMDIENSGYDIEQEWMYFRAGAYTQNNTGERGDDDGLGTDYDQITFYRLSNTHGEQ
jgi:poly(beta-D-mannuronate) lyase